MTDCPGACNAGYRRAITANAVDPGQPNPGQPWWCPQDAARIRRQFAELDYAAALYVAHADGHREQGGEPTRRTSHSPSPSPAGDTIEELTRFLQSWEDAYREHRDLGTAIRHGYLADVRSEIIAWLGERMDGLLEAPFAADFGREVAEWHHHLSQVGKLGTGRHWKPLVPCPWCGLRMLYQIDGDDHLACTAPGCRCRITKDEYHALVGVAGRSLEQVS